jgi:hypothetical protein
MTWKLMLDRDSLGTYRDESRLCDAVHKLLAANEGIQDELYVLGFSGGQLRSTLKATEMIGQLREHALAVA